MRKALLLIPAMCLAFVACGRDGYYDDDSNDVQSQENSESSSDWTITSKVKAEIMADTSISGYARWVSVSTTDGVVTLTGTAPTREDREKVVKIAKRVKGVMRVDNQITVQ